MSKVEQRIKELGYVLPECPVPVAAYVPVKKFGNFIFASGQTAQSNGKPVYIGKVGQEISLEEARKSAELCALRLISALKTVTDLDKVHILKVTGFVNAVPDYKNHPQVVDGASVLLESVFLEKGHHARSAIGMGSLPGQASVEVELIAAVEE